MHFLTLVALPPNTEDPIGMVAELLAPYYEEDNDDGWWDWYQIGGRWTGALDGYDPTTDPRNSEVCSLCRGTGTRPDAAQFGAEWMEWAKGCNGCHGTGIAEKWPTQWVDHPGDIARLGDVREKLAERGPYRVVGPELLVCAETYNPDGTDYSDGAPPETAVFIKHPEEVTEAIANLSDDCIVVVVDCHN